MSKSRSIILGNIWQFKKTGKRSAEVVVCATFAMYQLANGRNLCKSPLTSCCSRENLRKEMDEDSDHVHQYVHQVRRPEIEFHTSRLCFTF